MPTITVPRANLTSAEVCKALGAGLGAGYNVLPGMAMGRSAYRRPHPGPSDTIVVGTGSNRVVKAQIQLIPGYGRTELRVSPGGLTWDLLLNSLGIARKVRRVLASSPGLR